MTGSDEERIRRLLFDTAAVKALRQVLDVAREANVVVAPVKGVVLSRWLYESIDERPYRDLDVLIGRDGLEPFTAAVAARGWRVRHRSVEMGELELEVGGIVVEMHAEFGRRDLSRLTVGDVLARATPDRTTLSFEIARIDDVDHFLLLVTNVTKKSYSYAAAHHPDDLARLLARLEGRWEELVARAREASLLTAVRSVSRWMAAEKDAEPFQRFLRVLPATAPRLLPAVVRLHRRIDLRRPGRLERPAGLFGLALATLTPDDPFLRARGLSRLMRRGLLRRLGRDPG